MQKDTICIEVAYATPSEQKIISLEVVKGTTLLEAVQQSGITDLFPEISLANRKIGLFGKLSLKPETQVTQNGDRIEIYRPLIADPKEVRKKRAAQMKDK